MCDKKEMWSLFNCKENSDEYYNGILQAAF